MHKVSFVACFVRLSHYLEIHIRFFLFFFLQSLLESYIQNLTIDLTFFCVYGNITVSHLTSFRTTNNGANCVTFQFMALQKHLVASVGRNESGFAFFLQWELRAQNTMRSETYETTKSHCKILVS